MGVYITHELTNVDGLDRPSSWDSQYFASVRVFGVTMGCSFARAKQRAMFAAHPFQILDTPIGRRVAAHSLQQVGPHYSFGS